MNPRIQQLVEQSGISLYKKDILDKHFPELYDSVYCESSVEQLEKFAELVVRECMEVCADRGKHHDGLYSAWASDCSERIGKRFGVEK